jgi:bacterioferritin-associated ferredoxin
LKETTNFESEYVCACKGVTLCDLKKAFLANSKLTYSDLQRDMEVGLQCASCEYEVKGALDDYRAEVGIASEVDDRPLLLRRRGLRATVNHLIATLRGKTTHPMKAGLFVIRQPGFESAIIVSNLDFPELEKNSNGSQIKFRATFYDQAGNLRATSAMISLAARASREYPLSELFPELQGDCIGAVYLEFPKLHLTGSLRPYAVLKSKGNSPAALSRSHYHDKYATFTDPGYFQTAYPCFPGQTCWAAIVNCQDLEYATKVTFKTDTARYETDLRLGPMETVWKPILDFFPGVDFTGQSLDPALFFLDNPQHTMVWFFWHSDLHQTWIANHH